MRITMRKFDVIQPIIKFNKFNKLLNSQKEL